MIRFLTQWNGYDDQDVVSLGESEETRLVGLGVATFKLDVQKPQGGMMFLSCSGVAQSVTGSTAETALATIDIPPGAMGPNSALQLMPSMVWTSNANTKTGRIRIGTDITGTAVRTYTVTTTSGQHYPLIMIHNRGLVNSQWDTNAVTYGTGLSIAGSARTIDFALDNKIFITAQLGNAGDTFTLNAYTAFIINPYQ
jgi:hypothetical protein